MFTELQNVKNKNDDLTNFFNHCATLRYSVVKNKPSQLPRIFIAK